jgi:hypothetical protein
LVLYLSETPQVSALTDEELLEIRDGFDARRDAYLTKYLTEPPLGANIAETTASSFITVEGEEVPVDGSFTGSACRSRWWRE